MTDLRTLLDMNKQRVSAGSDNAQELLYRQQQKAYQEYLQQYHTAYPHHQPDSQPPPLFSKLAPKYAPTVTTAPDYYYQQSLHQHQHHHHQQNQSLRSTDRRHRRGRGYNERRGSLTPPPPPLPPSPGASASFLTLFTDYGAVGGANREEAKRHRRYRQHRRDELVRPISSARRDRGGGSSDTRHRYVAERRRESREGSPPASNVQRGHVRTMMAFLPDGSLREKTLFGVDLEPSMIRMWYSFLNRKKTSKLPKLIADTCQTERITRRDTVECMDLLRSMIYENPGEMCTIVGIVFPRDVGEALHTRSDERYLLMQMLEIIFTFNRHSRYRTPLTRSEPGNVFFQLEMAKEKGVKTRYTRLNCFVHARNSYVQTDKAVAMIKTAVALCLPSVVGKRLVSVIKMETGQYANKDTKKPVQAPLWPNVVEGMCGRYRTVTKFCLPVVVNFNYLGGLGDFSLMKALKYMCTELNSQEFDDTLRDLRRVFCQHTGGLVQWKNFYDVEYRQDHDNVKREPRFLSRKRRAEISPDSASPVRQPKEDHQQHKYKQPVASAVVVNNATAVTATAISSSSRNKFCHREKTYESDGDTDNPVLVQQQQQQKQLTTTTTTTVKTSVVHHQPVLMEDTDDDKSPAPQQKSRGGDREEDNVSDSSNSSDGSSTGASTDDSSSSADTDDDDDDDDDGEKTQQNAVDPVVLCKIEAMDIGEAPVLFDDVDDDVELSVVFDEEQQQTVLDVAGRSIMTAYHFGMS